MNVLRWLSFAVSCTPDLGSLTHFISMDIPKQGLTGRFRCLKFNQPLSSLSIQTPEETLIVTD
jgi:hypothetical protein